MTRTPLALWFGIFAPPLAWALQLWLGYAVEEMACSPGGEEGAVFGVGPRPLVVALTVAAGLVTALAIGACLRVRRPADDPRGRIGFMARAGALGGGLFLLLIVLALLLPAGLEGCRAG